MGASSGFGYLMRPPLFLFRSLPLDLRVGPLLMAAGRVLLRVRSHSGPCLDLLQSGIVRTSARPLKGPAAVARPPGCVVAIPFSRHSASGRKTAYLRSVRAAKDMDRGIDSAIYLGFVKLIYPIV